jgi:plasmid stabilization system protein ParE
MVETYRVIVSPRAFDDLDRIFDYIKSNSPQNARKMLDRLWMAMQSLSAFPSRYKVYRRAHGPYRRTVRAIPVRPFVIYYCIAANSQSVEMLTVRHGARRKPKSGEL